MQENKVGMQPDPEGIDGDKDKQTSNASQMVQELDALTKYLQGVRVPNAIQKQGAQPSYTLEGMRNLEKANNLYQMAPIPAKTVVSPPSGGKSSGIAKTELIDEMYQSISEFENKLKKTTELNNLASIYWHKLL